MAFGARPRLATAVLTVALACASSTNTTTFGTQPEGGREGGDGGGSLAHGDAGQLQSDGSHGLPGTDAGVNVDPCTAAGGTHSTTGCEYYVVVPDVPKLPFYGAGACFAAFVVNPGTTPVTLTVDFNAATLDPSTFGYIPSGAGKSITYAPLSGAEIPAGQVAILFLNYANAASPPNLDYGCPAGVKAAVTGMDAAQHRTGLGHAFHIGTSAPVVAYDIYPYGGGRSAITSATLLLPVSSWGTNYVAVDGFPMSKLALSQPFISIVASQDGTEVTINPTTNVAAATGVVAAPAGTPTTYTLNHGQLLELSESAELTGSIVQSTAPVGLWGGNGQMNVGVDTCCSDSAHQQIPPVRALGSEYVAARYRNRYSGTDESPPYRFVGAATGTTLSYDPAPPSGAPSSLGLGEIAEFTSSAPFVVSSQDSMHPFYVAGYMTGAGPFDPALEDDGGSGLPADARGDAEFVNVVPPAEYLSSYVFFTDPTYPETNLVLVRKKGASGFDDVTLDCAGTLMGWQPVGSSGTYEFLQFDLVTGDFAPHGTCNNGRHEIHSASPFGLTVWGWGSSATAGFYSQYVSYAYPAGASIEAINPVVIPPSAPK